MRMRLLLILQTLILRLAQQLVILQSQPQTIRLKQVRLRVVGILQ